MNYLVHKYVFAFLIIIIFFCLSCKDNKVTNPEINNPIDSTGNIFCNSYPNGANIILDTTDTQKITPDTIYFVEKGSHNISFRLEGYSSYIKTINVEPFKTLLVDVVLDEITSYWWTAYDLRNIGVTDRHIVSIAFDSSGNKWLATGSNGIILFDEQNNLWTLYNKNNSPLTSDIIRSLAVDNANNLWIASSPEWNSNIPQGGGLFKYNGNWEKYDSTNSPIISNSIMNVATDIYNNIWFIAYTQINQFQISRVFLYKYDGTNFIEYNSSNSPLEDNQEIYDLFCDNNGRVWLAGYKGLYVFNGKLNKILNAPFGRVFSVAQNNKGEIYIGADNGNIYKYENDSWQIIQTGKNLNIKAFAIDKDDILWFGGNASGVIKYQQERFTDYSGVLNQLLTTDDVDIISIDKMNRKWVGTNRGIAVRK